jgi:hypothetical protein
MNRGIAHATTRRPEMGSGNFGGGGSVSWEVINSDGEPGGGGDKDKCKGKDKGASTSPGDKLYVTCTDAQVLQSGPGSVVVEITLVKNKDKQVVLKWGADAQELRDRWAAQS